MASEDSSPRHVANTSMPWEAVFNASPLPTGLSRLRDGLVVAVNDAWLAALGLTREQALGRTTVELGHWPNEAARQDFLRRLLQGPTYQTLCFSQGQTRRVRIQSTVLSTEPEPLLMVVLSEITQEYETEQALHQANQRLQQQVELHEAIEKMARVGHWTNAVDDHRVDWSPGLFAVSGIEPQPFFTRSEGRSGIHPDDLPAWLAAREALDGREVEVRWTRPDGVQRWFRTRMGRTAVAGNPQTDFGVVQDITAEKEAVQALAGQLAFISNVTARVPGVLFQAVVRPDGTSQFPYMSQGVVDMLEMDGQDLQTEGNRFFSRVHPEDKKTLIASLQRSARELTFWRGVYRVVLPTRGLRWYSVDAQPQREPDGSTLWHGFCNDVTSSRLAEQVLQRQNRMLEAVQQAQAAFIEADDGRRAIDSLLNALLEVTGSEYGFVGEVLYDLHDQPYLKTHAVTHLAWDESTRRQHDKQVEGGMEFRNTRTVLGRALLSGETVMAHGSQLDGQLPGDVTATAFVGVPLAVGDRLVAMVGLANQPGGYSEKDVEFLQPLLGAVRQLVLAWRNKAERSRSRLQLQATSALLAEKSAALQVTFDSMSQGLTMVDASGRIRFYNRRFLELLDLPESLLEAQPLHRDVVAFQNRRGDFGDNYSLLDASVRAYVGQEPAVLPPELYLRRTVEGRVLEIYSRLLPEGGMVRTYSDVTSLLEGQEALRRERQRLAWVLEATRPGVWEFDHRLQVFKVDERWAGMLGYTLQELEPLTEHTWRRLTHPDDIQRMERLLGEHLAGQSPFYECDIRMRHKAGHWIWINDRARVHERDEHGAALYMSGTHMDITDRVMAQEQVGALNATLEQRVRERTQALERSMRDMEAISYSIAHDLRAPLRSVNGFAALIAEEDGDQLSPLARDMFGRITRSSRSMGQMITDMLELLRVVRVELERVPVDMAALARTAIETLASDVPQVHIDIQPLPLVMGDAILLRQVLVNLLDNALKYSKHREQPELVLGFDRVKGAFFLRDNGVGFNMAHAEKLFGLFQRLHPGSEVPGTGVGLAIVARIIERHGGRIWADSRPDEGATFWWTLPQT
ncbi:MAG: PAS domain-containing protein [Hydrogenophaga sp.]|nr:PAS domain-containing protein [Hydrogenophaga sp.]